MATTTMVHVRVDEKVKAQATETLASMGLTVSDAIRVFLTRVVADKELPFALRVPNTETRAAMEASTPTTPTRLTSSMGRPLVTTDSVGCRDVVDDGVNGYLCRPRDAIDLADKMARIVDMEPYQREAMGLKGRAKVKGQYSEHIVVNKYIESIRSIVHSLNP